MNKKIKDFAYEYFLQKYDDIELIFIDDKKVVLKYEELQIKLAIPFMSDTNFDEISKGIEDCSVDNEKELNNFMDIFEESLDFNDFDKSNTKLKIFTDKGYKFGDTVEFIIRYSVLEYENDEYNGSLNTFDLDEFSIGNVDITIGTPSDIFKIVFHEFEDDDYYVGWNAYSTVTLKGITADNYKDLLQQVMFWIYQICPSVYDFSFPVLSELCWEYVESEADFGEDSKAKLIFKEEYDNRKFIESKNAEPIHFYNAAKRINDSDISFLYFYKVLEFYFIISQKESIKNLIAQYNINNNIDYFIDTMFNDYFGKREDLLLNQMLSTLPKTFITKICNDSYNSKIILEDSLESFIDALYKYRNSIVHGKYEFKSFSLKMPDEIDDSKNKEWVTVIEKIAFQLILKYCYGK